jgi:predicted nucleotidyltransferase component of viral defense system
VIPPKDIQQKANKEHVRDTQVEKDYVLTWVLQGISHHTDLYQSLLFKGGTALKKIYFEDYRYSEDLDFTLINDGLTDEYILDNFNQICIWIFEKSHIPLAIVKNQTYVSGSINFQISYQGPLGGQGSYKRLKVDITRGEAIVFKSVSKTIVITYDDLADFSLWCYPLEEILIEKMCALMGRTEPRDLYDLWYLLEEAQLEPIYYWNEFAQKAHHKGHHPHHFTTKVKEKLPLFKARWEGSLSAQIHHLPLFEQVARDIGKHLRKIEKLT